ncbi:MAG: MmcQ/YjbR family DNA-binding protein [Candidatus Saccharimonadales bacterium]
MNAKSVEEYILGLANTNVSYPHGKGVAVYSVNDSMFALQEKTKTPLRISIRCDKQLAAVLKERYDEVMPGYKLNKDKWITVVLTGQLSTDEVKDLIIHSYNLALNEAS